MKVGDEIKSNIRKWSNELNSKQKEFESEESKLVQLRKLKKSVDKEIESGSKKL